MSGDELLAKDAIELRRLIGTRAISPVELMRATIARIEAVNPAVNALAATDFERALDAAHAAEAAVMRGDPLGALHGLPLGVKDLQETAGLLTTYGNIGRRGHVPSADAGLVARLRAAGAIVTAKTNVPDMGAGANTRNPVWGATGNPFDPRLNAGGSSGGSAATLATGMFSICTGSDTGGSLRIPSALCGVVGLRPSPGLVANHDRALGWSVISVLGPMARTVDDTAFLLSACAGFDSRDPLSYASDAASLWPIAPRDVASLRIGYTEDFGVCAVDADIRAAFRRRMAALEKVAACCEPIVVSCDEADRAFDVLRAESFLAAFNDVAPATLGPNVIANLEIARGITLADRARAHLAQTAIARRFDALFDRYDIVLAPVTPVSPFPWTQPHATTVEGRAMRHYYQWLELCYTVTLATNPALALPAGRDAKGMPFGLQVIGRLRGESALLASARSIEQVFASGEFARPLPDLARLREPRPELKSIVTHPPVVGGGQVERVSNAV